MASYPTIAKKNKQQIFTPSKTVTQLLSQLQNPRPLEPKTRRFKTDLNVQSIRSAMKKKWRDPGYVNIEFTKPPILRAKLLTEWQQDQIYQAQRSYNFPKGFKGIKFDQHSRKFREPDRQMYPNKFRNYLDKIKQQFQDKLYSAGPQMRNKRDRITRMLTQNSVKSTRNRNFMSSGYFGYSETKRKTLEDI